MKHRAFLIFLIRLYFKNQTNILCFINVSLRILSDMTQAVSALLPALLDLLPVSLWFLNVNIIIFTNISFLMFLYLDFFSWWSHGFHVSDIFESFSGVKSKRRRGLEKHQHYGSSTLHQQKGHLFFSRVNIRLHVQHIQQATNFFVRRVSFLSTSCLHPVHMNNHNFTWIFIGFSEL